MHSSGYQSDMDCRDSPSLSIRSFMSEGTPSCNNPAKSILRPRTGNEYTVVQRVHMPPFFQVPIQSPPVASPSPNLSRIFSYDLEDADRSYQENVSMKQQTGKCTESPRPCPHCNCYQMLCECMSNSVSNLRDSPSCQNISQRSPSLATSASDTLKSNLSLCHIRRDPLDRSPNIACSHIRQTSLSISTPSSLSPSPKPSNRTSVHQISPHFQPTHSSSAKLTQAEYVGQGNTVFFPDELSLSVNTVALDPAQHDNSLSADDDENYHIYVNQEFVLMHYHQNSSYKSGNSHIFSSHSSASPCLADLHSRLSLFKDSSPSKHFPDQPDILRRGSRHRSRHSESDSPSRHISHSFGAADRLQKSLTLPSSVQRSNSDPKRSLLSSSHLHSSHSQSHVHEKKFDKFAQSSIIARRRFQHATMSQSHLPSTSHENPVEGQPINSNVFTSYPGLLQVPLATKSTGYRNIDTMKSLQVGSGNNHHQHHHRLELQSHLHSGDRSASDFSHSPGMFESSPSPGLSDTSYLSCNSYLLANNSSSPQNIKIVLPSSSSPPPTPITPPPVPPRRDAKYSSPKSPPSLVPCRSSDSPPPYRAPPPPLLPRKPDLPKAVKYDSLSSISSEDEQELIYIEVDMTERKEAEEVPPFVQLSRRSRRARQHQKELDSMRYAEIDHTATKALKETSELLRDDRLSRSMAGSSLSRKNSSFSSKNRKPSCQTAFDRQLSTASIESC